MKKKIYSGAFALALLVAATVGVQESKKNDVLLNDLALANVEALANGEVGGGSRPYQSQGYCTIWQLRSMCSSKGAYTCTRDC